MEALLGISLHSGIEGRSGVHLPLHNGLSQAFVSVGPQCSTWQEVSPTRIRLTSIAGDKALLARGLDHKILSFLLHVHVMLILTG